MPASTPSRSTSRPTSSATCSPDAARRIQLNVDATRMSQAFTGSGYIQTIVTGEVDAFLQALPRRRPRRRSISSLRARFNPELNRSWFGAMIEVIDQVTMLSIILTGAALIREREHGTIEHLLVMPVTPFEIMTSKVWAMGLVVLAASAPVACCRRPGAAGGADRRLASRCSWPARRCICSRRRRWASSSPPSRARCRSSACC